MKYWKTYLERYAVPDQQISDPPPDDLGSVIVIPAFREISVIRPLASLLNCKTSDTTTEVIVVINEPEDVSEHDAEINSKCYQEATMWVQDHKESQIQFHVLYIKGIPSKKHGVGYARKIGMDEAVKRFDSIHRPKGVIICFDADSTCSPNYLVSVENHFRHYPGCPGASIYFEHKYDHLNTKAKDGIIQYELHLRYFIHAQRYAGFAAFQTVGSSMAVPCVSHGSNH